MHTIVAVVVLPSGFRVRVGLTDRRSSQPTAVLYYLRFMQRPAAFSINVMTMNTTAKNSYVVIAHHSSENLLACVRKISDKELDIVNAAAVHVLFAGHIYILD